MKNGDKNDPAKKYFDSNTTDRERAIFEGAITLGALYHQFVGASIHDPNVLEKAMEETATAQPFTKTAKVEITPPKEKQKPPYEYPELTGNMLKINISTEYNDERVELGMKYVSELDYPLMFIKKLKP
ncbi:MAG: dihydroneopterin aldolase [Hadesarchaea archaeon]|nr:dihydroneopterin aldolase [Hadesarchaea archaeon]